MNHDEHDTSARARIWGEDAAAIEAKLLEADPDLAALIMRVAYGEVFERPQLDLRTRELLSVALLSALGAERELPTHLRGALRCGASVDELRETILQVAMFAGFPRALAAMRVLARHLPSADDTATTD
jgi:4-carboxymuconolactone decarboxylase